MEEELIYLRMSIHVKSVKSKFAIYRKKLYKQKQSNSEFNRMVLTKEYRICMPITVEEVYVSLGVLILFE